MSTQQDLIIKLKEIFQIDRADLDFGIYRILNSRSQEIGDYLAHKLPEQIRKAFTDSSNLPALEQQLADKIRELTEDGQDPEKSKAVKELKDKLAHAKSSAGSENIVYSHLATFFSRYYEAGDFISQRRYKGDTYAVPYNGEEVLLHWANKDQYYTKSGEYFGNYRFTLEGGRQVAFRLIAADTAKDNQKDKDRVFVFAQTQTVSRTDEDGESYEEIITPFAELADGSLEIRFEYKKLEKEELEKWQEIHNPSSGEEQKNKNKLTLVQLNGKEILSALPEPWKSAVAKPAPTEKDKKRTLLEKHLTDYTAKNSADYFIHKDLGGFLRRELDFYIKNEVMKLDDIQNADSFARIERDLRQIQTLRAIAHDIIDFLAQLENFQKKLWLKKKFVAACHYLITLDRIPEHLLPAIFANRDQSDNWKNLFVFNELPPPRAI